MPTLIRSASLTNFSEIAQRCHLDPLALVRSVGLPIKCLSEPDLKIETDAVVRLLDRAAEQAGEPAFGLLMGESRRLSNLGPLGLLLRDSPTLQHAFEALLRHIRVHNEALTVSFEVVESLVVIRLEMAISTSESRRQAVELAIAVTYRILSLFLGQAWRPRMVCFTHQAPKNRTIHRRIFGDGLAFNHEFSGLVCNLADLNKPNPSADPVMAKYAQELISAKSVDPLSFKHQVQQIILLLLPQGQCRAEVVAQYLGCDRRTITRRLASEGTQFHALVDQHRTYVVQQCLLEPSKTMTQISALLGFSAPSAFSRWYKHQFGVNAREFKSTREKKSS